ncbi:MAG TPA: radical SAM family heme chaperone HemW [Candidatus Marinimicrobia bacterium]|nr:radical SAM family heme chaperone HemW [Candidatus Neomarinimicrobiota bacterium]
MKTSAGIYIHTPFCAVKCMYCDFYSIANREEVIPRFIKTIITEIERCEVDTSNWKIDTIFLGGGTPSLLESKYIESILESIQTKYDLSSVTEFTIEANPGEAPRDRLKEFRNLGINRLSMGVQSLEPDLLKFLTRIHSVEQVFETYDNARSIGFDNVNFDLIYSIPGQTWEVWERDINRIIDLQPNHISAYTLTLEKGTDLFKLVKDKKVRMPENAMTGEWFLKTHQLMESKGYPSYEISNFSQPGFECRHNLHYWKIHPYLAFGPSAHGFDGTNRWNNSQSLDLFLQQIESGNSPISRIETLTEKDKLNELIGFGLRMNDGIDLKKIPKIFQIQFGENLKIIEKKWEGCFIKNENSISLTKTGMVFGDAIGVDLML